MSAEKHEYADFSEEADLRARKYFDTHFLYGDFSISHRWDTIAALYGNSADDLDTLVSLPSSMESAATIILSKISATGVDLNEPTDNDYELMEESAQVLCDHELPLIIVGLDTKPGRNAAMIWFPAGMSPTTAVDSLTHALLADLPKIQYLAWMDPPSAN